MLGCQSLGVYMYSVIVTCRVYRREVVPTLFKQASDLISFIEYRQNLARTKPPHYGLLREYTIN